MFFYYKNLVSIIFHLRLLFRNESPPKTRKDEIIIRKELIFFLRVTYGLLTRIMVWHINI